MKRKIAVKLGFILLFALVCIFWSGSIQAQDYPSAPVQIIIPFGTGGLTDLFWRSLSDAISKSVNATLVLVNKGGGGGVVGTAFTANAKPDGYTLFSANSDPLTISPVFTANVPYNPETDFTYIAKLAAFAQCLAVRSDSPIKTLDELVAYAKANPKKLKSAVMGVGSTPHTILQVFKQEAGLDIGFVPFDSGGETVITLVGGHTDMCVISLSALKSQYDAGKIRILAVASPKRLPSLPDVPTLAEKGFKRSSIATGVGLAGPKGLDPAIVSKWEAALDKTMQAPEVVAIVEKLGGAVVDYKTGAEYRQELLSDLNYFKEMIPKLSDNR